MYRGKKIVWKKVLGWILVGLLVFALICFVLWNRGVFSVKEAQPELPETEEMLSGENDTSVISTQVSTQVVPTQEVASVMSGDWEIEYYAGATSEMKDWSLQVIAPESWAEFPNIDNPKVDFKASDGLEYGMDEHQFCQQDETCDITVPALHYRIVSGDYRFDFDECTGTVNGQGCAIMIVNVGNVTAVFRDINIDLGFNVMGRYWNGDALPIAIWGGLSHVGSNMLNLTSKLNPDTTNAGANCSVAEGCKTVRLAFIITSGNEILVKGVTTVGR